MYSGISFGIWGGVATRQLAVQPTSSHTGAVTESSPKERNRKHSQHERVFQLNVHCPQKRWRLETIINLKTLNSYLVVSHFKMESIGSLKDGLQEGDLMRKIDLEDAYLSVPVHQEHRDFLKFCWRQKIYQFRSLPFGLATAPRVFTKILRPFVARMRMTGLCIIVYLDDIMVMAQSAEILKSHMQTLARELQAVGFKLNHKKCVWEPVQVIEFLVFLVNSKTMKIYLPEEKIQKVMKECRHTINKRSVTA